MNSATNYFQLVENLGDERDYHIWNQVISSLDFLDNLEQGRLGREVYQQYVRGLLRPQLQRLGWVPKSGEPVNDVLLRNRVISVLGKLGDREVIAESRARFERFLSRPGSLPAELRSPVLLTVGRYADRATLEQLHKLARNARTTEERQLFYHAMAGALDPDLAVFTLAISLTDETVPQETAYLPAQVAQLGEHQQLAWDFAQRHLKELLGQVESFRRNVYVPAIVGTFSDAPRADELLAFVKENVGEDAVAKARETATGIRLKAAIKDRELPQIDAWVKSRTSIARNQ